MAGVTIVNGTNMPINVSLSAAFNYDWKNRLNPNEYVVLTKGVLVSLNARFWAGEPTEYDASLLDIGLFVAGTIVGLIGLALCFVPGGQLLVVAASAGFAGSGILLGGVSVLAKELINTPAHLSSITVADNRKFLITGKLDLIARNGVGEITGGDSIKIKELIGGEFEAWLRSHKPLLAVVDPEASEPVGTYHATKSDLEKDGVLNKPVWIYSALGGVPHTNPPCWRILNGSVQLSGGSGGEEIVWQIEYAKQYSRDDVAGGPLADAFRLRNPKAKRSDGSVLLNQCASVTSTQPDGDKDIKASPQSDDAATLFFIIKSGNCYAFVPCCRQQTYVVNADGALAEGTKISLHSNETHPGRARWAVDPLLMPGRKLTAGDLAKILDDEKGIVQQRVRILPALLRDRIFDGKLPPPYCWGIEDPPPSDPRADTLVKINERDVSTIDWMVRHDPGAAPDTFTLYCPDLDAYATYHRSYHDSKLNETDMIRGDGRGSRQALSEFFITESMGYLCFHPKDDPTYSVFAEDITNGKKLKIAEWNKYPRSLARWVVVPRARVTLVKREFQFVGVFSENGEWRLDIGTNAMKKLTPKTTESWATKLVIRRLGATGIPIKDSGPVCEEHVVGIFSEDSQWRLDIGTDSVKMNTPSTTVSPTTKLIIGSPKPGVGSAGVVRYGDPVGIFSEDGQHRLDIGTDSMKQNTPGSVVSWATKLKIHVLSSRIPH